MKLGVYSQIRHDVLSYLSGPEDRIVVLEVRVQTNVPTDRFPIS